MPGWRKLTEEASKKKRKINLTNFALAKTINYPQFNTKWYHCVDPVWIYARGDELKNYVNRYLHNSSFFLVLFVSSTVLVSNECHCRHVHVSPLVIVAIRSWGHSNHTALWYRIYLYDKSIISLCWLCLQIYQIAHQIQKRLWYNSQDLDLVMHKSESFESNLQQFVSNRVNK